MHDYLKQSPVFTIYLLSDRLELIFIACMSQCWFIIMFYYFVVGVTLALIQTNGCFNFFLSSIPCQVSRVQVKNYKENVKNKHPSDQKYESTSFEF